MTTVLKLGGAVCLEEETLDALAEAVRRAPYQTFVVVHGGGPQLDEALLPIEGPPRKIDGLRVTSAAGADVVRTVLDDIGAHITDGLLRRGIHAQHLPAIAKRLRAGVKRIPDGDLGRVGTPSMFYAQGVLADAPDVMVVTPIGWDGDGPLNVNADEAAAQIALAIGAKDFIMATSVDHILDAAGEPLPLLDSHSAEALIATGAARDGMVPKIQAALTALAAGMPAVKVGRIQAAWDGSGTTIAVGA